MKKTNNWKLIGILAILLAVFFGVRYFRSSTLHSNLPDFITDIDTAAVTELIVKPAREHGSEIHLVKNGKTWDLKSGDRKGRLEQGSQHTALQVLMQLKPQGIVTRKKEKWDEYNVGDSTGTHVKVLKGESVVADLWIGRSGVQQGAQGAYMGGFTYVRPEGEDEVYIIETFMEGIFNRQFNEWRDKGFTRLKRDSIDRIAFQYPADSSFVIEKRNNQWFIGQSLADSTKVATYLLSMEFRNVASFAGLAPAGNPQAVAVFSYQSKPVITLEGWSTPGAWTMRSSYQPETFFSSSGAPVKDIWKGKSELLKTPKK